MSTHGQDEREKINMARGWSRREVAIDCAQCRAKLVGVEWRDLGGNLVDTWEYMDFGSDGWWCDDCVDKMGD